MSSTGRERIMGIKPSGLHQRVPVILGSKNEVERVVNYHNMPPNDFQDAVVSPFEKGGQGGFETRRI